MYRCHFNKATKFSTKSLLFDQDLCEYNVSCIYTGWHPFQDQITAILLHVKPKIPGIRNNTTYSALIQARSRAPLPPYKGDPRDFIQVTKDLHQQQQQQHLHPGMSQYGGVGRGGEGGQIRAPPPAHSHHNISSEQRTHANRESKSPARAFNEVMFAMYDKKPSHSPNRWELNRQILCSWVFYRSSFIAIHT